jgi:glycosyltransferase involved in cell wall biosynthesis
VKVIHILPYSSLATDNFKIDIFGDGYHVRTAKEILKVSDKYQMECWRPERFLKHQIKSEKDGIVYRAFPSWRPSLGKLTSIVYKNVVNLYSPLRWGLWREYSLELLKALKEECANNEVILYVYQIHFDMSYIISASLGHKVPIIGHSMGGTPYLYHWTGALSYFPVNLIEHKALSSLDALFLGSEWHYECAKKYYSGIPEIVYPMPQCVDFNLFKPMDKIEAKKSIGINPDKKVIIHIGRFDYAKGFDTILNILPALKEKYDVEFIGIGGTKTDMLYKKAVDNGVKVHEWLPQHELVKYYNASDVYLFPKFYNSQKEYESEKFMGAGVAPVEALACNVPIVGTNMKKFFATEEEREYICEIPDNETDLMACIDKVFTNPKQYSKCREIAYKYYAWKPRVDKMLDVFDRLSNTYYGG